MDITVIFNPTAGGGRAKRLRQFVRALEQGGARVRLYHTRAPGTPRASCASSATPVIAWWPPAATAPSTT